MGTSGGYEVSTSRAAQASEARLLYIKTLRFFWSKLIEELAVLEKRKLSCRYQMILV